VEDAGVANYRWLRRVRELDVGGEKWRGAVQGGRCCVLDAGRTEAGQPGDTPHSAQDSRYNHRSPWVHDPTSTLHLSQLAQLSMRPANFLSHDMTVAWR